MLPFGAIYVELFFIMNSLWFGRIYYMFGFLFLCYGIMIITCASVTVMFVYYLLCSENYRWQWRSFNNAGAGAAFVFAYFIIYWILKLRFAGLTSIVLYVGYSLLISFLFYILTGKSLAPRVCTFRLILYRHYWFLLKLGFCPPHLPINPHRLN